MEVLIKSTKEYLRNSELALDKLQDVETKLDTLKNAYLNQINEAFDDDD